MKNSLLVMENLRILEEFVIVDGEFKYIEKFVIGNGKFEHT